MNTFSKKLIFLVSLLVSILILISSLGGLLLPDLYSKETPNWQIQSFGQDYANLLIILPSLIISSLLIRSGKKTGFPLWAGTLLYLIYTYVIYCFDIHFNRFFLLYCFILGLCFYLLLYALYTNIGNLLQTNKRLWFHPLTACYFLIIAVLFYLLWLADIIPAIVEDTVPKSLTAVGLPTNAVHVIDLSVFLPGTFITGMLLLKKHPLAYLLIPIVLTFFILMDITICVLTVMMHRHSIETSLSVVYIMGILALFSTLLLTLHLKYNRTE